MLQNFHGNIRALRKIFQLFATDNFFVLSVGKAFSIIKTDKEKYVRGNGTFSQHIATYRFKVEKDDVYIVWIEVLGLSFKDNSVSYYIDNYKEKVAHLSILALQPSWTWNCLHQEVCLSITLHLKIIFSSLIVQEMVFIYVSHVFHSCLSLNLNLL